MTAVLPAYTVKISARARRISLRVSRATGLVVTVPQGYDTRRLPGVLTEKLEWIQSALERVSKEPAPVEKTVPRNLQLRAIGQTWQIHLVATTGSRVTLKEKGFGNLEIRGQVTDSSAVTRAIKAWLKRVAQSTLPEWLERISQQTGLRYNALSIRDQRTRWGSCSAAGNISLNMKLLLLPPELVEYVLVHELCHTRVMSHSRKFWQLVESYYPRWQTARKELRETGKRLPF
jgi:predicted metal-dependent hydrolase